MKNFSRLMTSAVALTALAGASAAYAASETGTATANIVAAVTITEDNGIDFGSIVAPTTDSEVSIDTLGAIAVDSGDANALDATGTAGSFTVTAGAGETIVFTVGSSTTQDGVTLTNFVGNYNGDGESALNNDTATAVASGTLLVGATLDMTAADVTTGVKNLSYTITADYQ